MHIQKVLKYTRGNKVEASKLLCIGLTTLYRKIEEYRLYPEILYTNESLNQGQ
jgi:two-component system NtrC family response regulator